MKKLTDQDPETRSPDLVAGNIEQLKTLFPEAFTEGKIDFEVLKQVLGGVVDEREESVDWDTTQNLMIEGDNLEVLKLLQKSYAGKVKLIYSTRPTTRAGILVCPSRHCPRRTASR